MFPVLRLAKEIRYAKRAPRIGLFDTHERPITVMPWDLDPWEELNNGRTLTLYDVGRVPLLYRVGLREPFKARGWRFTVAGSSIRYRLRVQGFERLTMRSALLGWDEKFLYFEQSMWRADGCTSHMLCRKAVTGKGKMIPMAEVARQMDMPPSPALPGWAAAWAAADAQRPWPPGPPAA